MNKDRKSAEEREASRIANRRRGLYRTNHKHAPTEEEYQKLIAIPVEPAPPDSAPVVHTTEKQHPGKLSKKVFPK